MKWCVAGFMLAMGSLLFASAGSAQQSPSYVTTGFCAVDAREAIAFYKAVSTPQKDEEQARLLAAECSKLPLDTVFTLLDHGVVEVGRSAAGIRVLAHVFLFSGPNAGEAYVLFDLAPESASSASN